MSVKQVNVNVSEQMYNLGQNLALLVGSVKKIHVAGGGLEAVAAVVSAAVADLVPIIGEIGALPAEEKEDMPSFVRAIELSAVDVVKAVLS